MILQVQARQTLIKLEQSYPNTPPHYPFSNIHVCMYLYNQSLQLTPNARYLEVELSRDDSYMERVSHGRVYQIPISHFLIYKQLMESFRD